MLDIVINILLIIFWFWVVVIAATTIFSTFHRFYLKSKSGETNESSKRI
tara:strand:+ start:1352 stop:1498 length:147 start_codon:yes stop_codon:yes gene_type:complete